jgi:hypothetical protein
MEELRAQGAALSLQQAVALLVPLAVEVAERHKRGELLFVHPSALLGDDLERYHVSPELAAKPPLLPRDKACLAPEQRQGRPGNARASVYALGAILYELVTGLSVGPGMRRPSEVVPNLPHDLEVLLGKALVADPAHRPDDLKALAQAAYHMAPGASVRPPAADEAHLDHDENFDVDISLSMLPPEPIGTPYGVVVQAKPVEPAPSDSTTELQALKDRLESDPRPRYVVIREGMDHGPFTAVELLRQIASHAFVESDFLRDSFSNDERPIRDWDEFAPFAEHARLHRDIKAEKEALERVVVQETRSTRGKALLGIGVLGAVLVAAGVWFITQRGQRSDEVAIQGEDITSIELDGGLNLKKTKRGGARGGVVGTSNGYPILAGGMSCESAQAAYVEEMTIGGAKGPADITGGQYGAVLNRGSYFAHCGVPEDMSINICAAIQNGRAVGVTVVTKPRDPRIASCISQGVRAWAFRAIQSST